MQSIESINISKNRIHSSSLVYFLITIFCFFVTCFVIEVWVWFIMHIIHQSILQVFFMNVADIKSLIYSLPQNLFKHIHEHKYKVKFYFIEIIDNFHCKYSGLWNFKPHFSNSNSFISNAYDQTTFAYTESHM